MPRCRVCHADQPSSVRFCRLCGAPQRGTATLLAEPTTFLTEADKVDLSADRRVVTVLFADLAVYSTLEHGQSPERVADVLNAFFRVLTEPIYRYGGVVDKYIGDVLMATFGAPVAHEDDAERAVRAALEMRESALRLARRLQDREGVGSKIRIGLNTGIAVAGHVGAGSKVEYTVMGDTVNLAQRMEANAPDGSILVADTTRNLAGDAFAFREFGEIAVKNRERKVHCHELLGLADASAARAVLLVGREVELAVLERAWSDACAGAPRMVRIAGETGTGKSALVEAFISGDLGTVCSATPGTNDRPWLRIACRSYSSQVPFHLVAQVVRGFLGLAEGPIDEDGIGAALRRTLPRKAEDPEAVAVFAILLGSAAPALLANLEPEHRQALVLRQVTELVLDRAHWEPFALVCEDLHWLDGASRAWLAHMERALAESPAHLLVIATTRTDDGEAWPGWAARDSENIHLGALPEPHCAELVRRLLPPDRPASPAEVAALVARSSGNPRFLAALAESVAAGEGSDRSDLPLSLIGLLAARLDAADLSAGGLLALEVAAVLGDPVRHEDFTALLGEARAAYGAGELTLRRILLPASTDALAFRYPLMRDVAYERTLVAGRRKIHAHAARHFESIGAPRALVGLHFGQAGMSLPAARAYLEAAEQALASFANQDALDLVAQARKWAADADAAPDSERRFAMVEGAAYAALGDLDRALERSGALLGAATEPEELAIAAERHAGYLIRAGDLPGAFEVCNEALERVAAAPDSLAELRLRGRRAQVRMRRGEVAQALADCDAVLARAAAAPPNFAGFLFFVQGAAFLRQANLERAAEAYSEAVRHFDLAGCLYEYAHAASDLGVVRLKQGRPDDAERCFDLGLANAVKVNDRRLSATLLNNQALLAHERGQIELALGLLGRALDIYREIKDQSNLGLALMNIGELQVGLGETEAGEACLREAIAILEAIDARDLVDEAYRQLTQALIGRGALDEALVALERAYLMARQTGQREREGAALRHLAEIARSRDDSDGALRWAAQSVQVLKEVEAPLELGRSYAELAEALLAIGRSDQAGAARNMAVEILTQIGARADLERVSGVLQLVRGTSDG